MERRIITYRTKHFEFRVPIDEWNENKKVLPEGAGAKFIAPSDLTAILLEPFYYDPSYETDGRTDWRPALVYDEKWVGKEIRLFLWCKELFEFLGWLRKKHGWYIFDEWWSFYLAVRTSIADEQSITLSQVTKKDVAVALQNKYNFEFSGTVWQGAPECVGNLSRFLSAREDGLAPEFAFCLLFGSGRVNPDDWHFRFAAFSVRCVSGLGSFPNS